MSFKVGRVVNNLENFDSYIPTVDFIYNFLNSQLMKKYQKFFCDNLYVWHYDICSYGKVTQYEYASQFGIYDYVIKLILFKDSKKKTAFTF